VSVAEQLQLYCAQAEALIDHGRASEAGERLAQALRLDPQSGLALGLMSLVKLRLGERGEAVKLARESIAFEPDQEWGHRVLSIALRLSGKHSEAIEPAREAARLASDSPDVLRNLAVSLMQVHALEEARQVAERIVLLSPESAEGYELLGLVSAAEGRKKEAEQHWREALARDPENPTFHNNLALTLLERGADGEAVERFFGALRNDPKSDTYHENLGVGLERFRNASGRYFLAFFLGFLLLLSIVGVVEQVSSGEWRGAEGAEDAASTLFSLLLWGGLTFAYMRHFLKWRRERIKVLPLLRTWRPRKPWRVRFFAGWRDALRSPPFIVYVGMILLLIAAATESELPFGPWLLLLPGAVVLWGLWRWIFRRRSPPIDTEL
jgi:tetratricopeptide (TPR) repeat protein